MLSGRVTDSDDVDDLPTSLLVKIASANCRIQINGDRFMLNIGYTPINKLAPYASLLIGREDHKLFAHCRQIS